jgi:hypothetical protein
MSDTHKGMDAIAKWQADTRQEIVNEIGNAILKALHKIGFQQEADKPEVVRKPRQYKSRYAKRPAGRGYRPGTDMERVYKIIEAHPGNKGHQIQALLAQQGHVVHERTMRTCLNRLKARKYITQQADKAWYTTEAAKQ